MRASERAVRGVAWTLRVLIAASVLWGAWAGGFLAAVNALVMLPVAFAGPALDRWTRYRVPALADACVAAAAAVHAFGHGFAWYHAVPAYDNVLHFCVSATIGVLAWLAAEGWRESRGGARGPSPHPVVTGLFVVGVVALAGVLWELLEWGIDILLGTNAQHGLADTNTDLLFNVLGAATAAFLAPRTIEQAELAQEAEDAFRKDAARAARHES